MSKRRAAVLGDGWLPMNHALEDLPAAIREVDAMRADAGRDGTTEITVGGRIQSLDDVARYREAGVHRVIVTPFSSSREALDGIRRFGDEVIARV